MADHHVTADPTGQPGAIVLLSGGLDSATCLAITRDAGYRCVALSFSYGQRHAAELDAAAQLARAAGVEHVVIDIDLRAFGGSALTADLPVPKHDAADDIDTGVPITYVPARNTIFLSLALALAEVRGIDDVVIGVNEVDSSGYPDCRPAFVEAFETLANLATRAATEEGRRLRIQAPLLHLTKAEIIRRGTDLGVDYGATTSCYDPDPAGHACGRCDACLLRRRGFAEAGIDDPTTYAGTERAEGS